MQTHPEQNRQEQLQLNVKLHFLSTLIQLKDRKIPFFYTAYNILSFIRYLSIEAKIKIEKGKSKEKIVVLINSIRSTAMISTALLFPQNDEEKKNDKRMTNAISLFLRADILCMPDVSKTIAIFF